MLQVKPQLVPLHVEVPLVGGTQGEQLEPQVATSVFTAQAAPQRWKPLTHEKLQLAPEHTGLALAGVLHAAQVDAHER